MYIILAAGISRRMGFDKAFEPLHGVAPLARLARTLGDREFVVVVPSARKASAFDLAPHARAIVFNDEPLRGMNYSLRLALGTVDAGRAVGILLADKPFVTNDTLDRVEASLRPEIDVAYPVDGEGIGGHPVVFAPAARDALFALADGDGLRRVRDLASFARSSVVVDDRGAFLDLDTPGDWETVQP